MKKVIAKINFKANNENYVKGDEVTNLTYEQVVKLNELGFIEPLKYEDLIQIKRELKNPKKYKEEL